VQPSVGHIALIPNSGWRPSSLAMPGDCRPLRGAFGEGPLDMSAVLSASVWNVSQLLSPRGAQLLSGASPAVRSLLMPASERAKLTGQFARELRTLPFNFSLPWSTMSPKLLEETLHVLRPMHPLRRRDLVGRDAGYVPTDAETWCFHSEDELTAVIATAHLARQNSLQVSKHGPMLFAATLRVDDTQQLEGPLWTTSVGVEWAYGPTADPLQLGLRLGLHTDGHIEIDLDVGSGGWSPWAEHWTLQEDSLSACIAIAAALPDDKMCIIRTEIETPKPEVREAGWRGGCPCEIQSGQALRQTLVSAGEDGVRAVISLGSLRWQKAGPEWCPAEVQDLVLNQDDF